LKGNHKEMLTTDPIDYDLPRFCPTSPKTLGNASRFIDVGTEAVTIGAGRVLK